MSDKKELTERLNKIADDLKKVDSRQLSSSELSNIIESTQKFFNQMDPDDKKTLKNRYESSIARLQARRERIGKKKKEKELPIPMNAKGGSISKLKAGGFPDLSGDGKVTQKDVLMGRGVVKKANGGQINGLKKMGMKVGGLAGRLAQRGYGKARR